MTTPPMTSPPRTIASAGRRIVIGAACGVLVAVPAGLLLGWITAPSVFWVVAAGLWTSLTWTGVHRMDAAATARWATREDPVAGVAHVILILASLASLAGVALLLVAVPDEGRAASALLGVASVAASWATVHTVYALGYAARYYAGEGGGIDFNQRAAPDYADFAYLGFTLGMTYQVSDTAISDPAIRRMVLQHALLSYLLGAVVLAIAINAVATLAS